MDEDSFEAIATEAIEQAEAIDCSLPEFRDGLKVMLRALRARLEQVNDEIGEE